MDKDQMQYIQWLLWQLADTLLPFVFPCFLFLLWIPTYWIVKWCKRNSK